MFEYDFTDLARSTEQEESGSGTISVQVKRPLQKSGITYPISIEDSMLDREVHQRIVDGFFTLFGEYTPMLKAFSRLPEKDARLLVAAGIATPEFLQGLGDAKFSEMVPWLDDLERTAIAQKLSGITERFGSPAPNGQSVRQILG